MTDQIDLTTVEYHNSPSVASWPATSELLEVSWANRRLTVRHTETGAWPPVPFETTTQEGTFWLFLQYDNRWHGAGAERFRPNQTEKELGSPFDMTGGWLYDANRWGSMANRTLREGEVVGVMMTSGDMRSQMAPGPMKRTAVRLARVRANGIELMPASVETNPPAVVVQPPTTTTPPQTPAGPVVDLEARQLIQDVSAVLLRHAEEFAAFKKQQAETDGKQTADIAATNGRIDAVEKRVSDALATVRNAGGWLSGIFGGRR